MCHLHLRHMILTPVCPKYQVHPRPIHFSSCTSLMMFSYYLSLKTALSIKNKRHNDVFYWSRPQKLRSLPFDQNGEKTPPHSCLHPCFRGLSVWWERPPAHGLAVRLEPHDNFRGHRDLMKRWREVGEATVKVTRPRWPRPPPRRGAEPRTGGVWCPGSPAVLEGGLAGDRPGACRMRPPR